MAGIFALVNSRTPDDVQHFLDSAGKKLSHRKWNVVETWAHPTLPLGVGRLHLGIFNRDHQPCLSADGSCKLWLSGELYQTAALRSLLKLPAAAASPLADADLALRAYQEFGPAFASRLNGAFFIVIYDEAQHQLVLANDRYGLYPHYYHLSAQQLVLAPEVKGVLCAAGVERKPDLTAACEYFRFQQLFGEKTFHEGISLFPYGSVAQYQIGSGAWSLRRYWDWDQIPHRPEVTFNEAVEEAGQLLQAAIGRLVQGVRPGVFLSGGLDSRTILGLIPPGPTAPVSANFGMRNSRDVIYANQIARASRSRHYWFDLPDGNWVRENVGLHFQLTEGFHSWLHMHGISMLDDLRPVMDCDLTGWDGGTVMGHRDHINAIYNQPVDQWSVALRTYQQFNQAYTWPGLTDAEERLLYTPAFARQAGGRAFESLLHEFSRFWNFRHEYAAEYFYVVNHCWRFTHHMITTLRSSIEARFPFFDYDLIDFIYSLPPALRRDQLILRSIITRRTPRLALIPYDKQEYLPTVQPLLHTAQKVGLKVLKALKVHPERPLLYADYENYLRTDLREWAEELLFSPRAAQRGMFDPAFVRSLMNRHLAKNEDWIIGKIAPLMTYEMVLREFFD